MKRGSRFLVALTAAVITFVGLIAFVGPQYHLGGQYDNYYSGHYRHWYRYRPYWQPPPYPGDSLYTKPPAPQKAF